jgi:broad specificity phosphatase PhoE
VKRLCGATVLAVLAAACSAGPQRAPAVLEAADEAAQERYGLTVVLVRHAEKVDDSEDAALSEAGLRRAAALADALEDAGVVAIYTTQFQRTANTAVPLAQRVGVPAQVVAATGGAAHAADVAARVREHGAGTVVVVGHSNTVPAIIRALGGPAASIADDAYAHMFILRFTPQGVHFIRAQY